MTEQRGSQGGSRRTHWNILLGTSSTLPERRKLDDTTRKSSEDYGRGKESLECKRCKIKFYGRSRVSNLNKHVGAAHLNKRPFGCSECKKEFQFHYRLQKHIDTVHLGIKPFSCKHCNQRFSDKSNMTKHVRGRSCLRSTKSIDEVLEMASGVRRPLWGGQWWPFYWRFPQGLEVSGVILIIAMQ